MSTDQTNKIAAGFVVEGDVVSKGGTVFTYLVTDTETVDGKTTLTIREQASRPITARWKIPEGTMVTVHGARPPAADRAAKAKVADLTARIEREVGAIEDGKPDAILALTMEGTEPGQPLHQRGRASEPVIVALDPADFPDTSS